ncbi:Sec-dependent nitrous-oxide reductase [Carboxydochorda subterranea]|uniref:Sec-dependent nitrous-oxide reductase n=1 Tax=Carboxydichorda subterranea TaxID=3109565 RepID=A0ABZ1BXV9_9FIRM|nr:Sec-dependent nitrous-oxide reductase [Limnochorda sp. L945t]WRP17534.1 Sec-dependent nitrous-oxide reductase [Limnochorda sp. L945t]
MRRSHLKHVVWGLAALVLVTLLSGFSLFGGKETPGGDASKALVPPGKLDEYYLFASGGHSGQVFVYGVPSMRRIRTIPVFTPDPAWGYGYDEETKAMLGGLTWGDVHHPALSETNGEYDGRWLFVNDNANNRVARINLKTFYTEQILGPVPNIMGPHSATFVTPNTEYLFMGSRFATPVPAGTYVPIQEFKSKYYGVLAGVKIDPKSGHMELAWELLLPPWSFDLGDAGKKVSDGWYFLTTYNTEEAYETLEVGASARDRDFIVMVNWKEAEKAAAAGKFQTIAGAKVIDPVKVPGIVYLMPVAKSPHGVDVAPDGRHIAAAGKLQPTVTVYDFEKIKSAIEAKKFAGEERGLPILDYEAVRVAEVPVGLGPLHTQFDDKGYAYTSLFIDSAIVKWKIGEWKVIDKVDVHYNVGHLCAAEGDTTSPDGKWLVSLNKMAKDRFLPVGPSHPENLQLIDISGDKMKLVYESPVDPEPHYAQMIKADKIKPEVVFYKDVKRPNSVWDPKDARVVRKGNRVDAYIVAIRSRFIPDRVEVNEGDDVYFHLTNNDMDQDITHGFGIPLYNVDMQVEPGETKTLHVKATKPGVYPFYCTNFCSALHQEMQGWFLVKPKK